MRTASSGLSCCVVKRSVPVCGVALDGDLGGQRRRRALVAELLGDEPGDLTGRREDGDLGERDRADQRLAAELQLCLGHEQRVRRRVRAAGSARASGSVPTKANAAPMSAPMAMIGHRRISTRTYSIGSTTTPSVGRRRLLVTFRPVRARPARRGRRRTRAQFGSSAAAGTTFSGRAPTTLVHGRRVELAAGGEDDPGRRRRAASRRPAPPGRSRRSRSTSDIVVAARGRCTAVEDADGDPGALLRRDQRRCRGRGRRRVSSASGRRRRRGRAIASSRPTSSCVAASSAAVDGRGRRATSRRRTRTATCPS